MLVTGERINSSRGPIREAIEGLDAAFVAEEAREAGADGFAARRGPTRQQKVVGAWPQTCLRRPGPAPSAGAALAG